MTDKEKKAINKQIRENIYGTSDKPTKSHFRYGTLKRHLIIEEGSKFSNKVKFVSGEDLVKLSNLTTTINTLKYKLPEQGLVALVRSRKYEDELYIGRVIKHDNFGTNKLHYLKIEVKTIKTKEGEVLIEEEFMLDPRSEETTSYIVKTIATFVNGNEINISQLNKLLGIQFYQRYEILKTGFIPAEVFYNSFDGESDIEGLDEIFALERQLLKEIVRDLNLSRKKVLYKTRLANKSAETLELEMNNDSIVVFADGNAVFTSPIDLWSPALSIEAITRTIDWLINYTLKMKFAAKDTMSTGAQKTDEQVSEINQSAQNYLEDKKEMWSLYLTQFLNKIYETSKIEVEFELMTTINRVINGGNPEESK